MFQWPAVHEGEIEHSSSIDDCWQHRRLYISSLGSLSIDDRLAARLGVTDALANHLQHSKHGEMLHQEKINRIIDKDIAGKLSLNARAVLHQSDLDIFTSFSNIGEYFLYSPLMLRQVKQRFIGIGFWDSKFTENGLISLLRVRVSVPNGFDTKRGPIDNMRLLSSTVPSFNMRMCFS
jgi:hypothetical protein